MQCKICFEDSVVCLSDLDILVAFRLLKIELVNGKTAPIPVLPAAVGLELQKVDIANIYPL